MVVRSLAVVALGAAVAAGLDATRLTAGFTGVLAALVAAVVVFATGVLILLPELRKLYAVARRKGQL